MGAAHLSRAVRSPHSSRLLQTAERSSFRDKLWAKADRDMSGSVGNQKQDQPQASGQATRTSTSTSTGMYLLLVHSAMWETGRGTRTRQNPMETLSATHPDTFHLSLFLSLSPSHSVSHCLPLSLFSLPSRSHGSSSLFLRQSASIYCTSTFHTPNSPTPCACPVLYCTA